MKFKPAPAVLNLQSGDLLVIQSSTYLPSSQIEKMRNQLRDQLPANIKVLVLDKGVSLAVVRHGSVPGWIVTDASGEQFRIWDDFGPNWTTNRDQALRFARQADAEAFSQTDEDAWKILPFDPTEIV